MSGPTLIIDYGSGNLRSAAKAFERASASTSGGGDVIVSGDAARVDEAARIVLPGVGAFGDCAAGLKALPGMVEALTENVIRKGKPFLGICVGMQLMAERGLEHGVHEGLGWIRGEVTAIDGAARGLKVPHMGWNDLAVRTPAHPLLAGISSGAHAYFVHGYRFAPADEANVLAEVDYGDMVCAAIGRDNMAGTQFHPEKSQKVGLAVIANFLAWRP